jgi:hypothetical protein
MQREGKVGRDSSVGIATCHGLDGPGIESRWGGARFSAPVQTGSEAHPASNTSGPVSFPRGGVNRPRCGVVDHSPPSSAEVKERVGTPLFPLWAIKACFRVYVFYEKGKAFKISRSVTRRTAVMLKIWQ